MKSCRRGFIRCKRRDGPWGSHQVDARALKCETSVGLTEEEEVEKDEKGVDLNGDEEIAGVLCPRNWFWTERGVPLRRRRKLRRAVGVRDEIVGVMFSDAG
jgi:hypothetical protein